VDDKLFEDMPKGEESLALDEDADDRALLYAIWAGKEQGDLPVQDGWRILHERYPADMGLLVALVSEEIHESDAGSPEQVCSKLEKVLDAAKGRLNDEVRDLLAFARLDFEDDSKTGVRRKKPLSAATQKRVAAIRARVGEPKEDVWDEGGPVARLAGYRRKLVRTLHDATLGHKPIRAGAVRAPDSWREMLAAAKTKVRYSASAVFASGDAVDHPKFGVGVVTAVEKGRVTILFESGERKLVVRAGDDDVP
jgi:hypothetical protein